MDQIRFDRALFEFGAGEPPGYPVAVPIVNERPLVSIADGVDAPLDDEDAWEESGSTLAFGVVLSLVQPPSRHWLDAPNPRESRQGRALVLDCACGYWQCGGLLARIEVGDRSVLWHDFADAHWGQEPYAHLGPFEFDHEQYEAALAALGQAPAC